MPLTLLNLSVKAKKKNTILQLVLRIYESIKKVMMDQEMDQNVWP